MNAAVIHAHDRAPRYEPFTLPAPRDGLVVDVLAAALSPRSRAGASGQHYTSTGALPLVPGIDGVGQLPDGRRVYFLAADDQLGTMAEKTIADPRLLAPLPDGVGASAIAAAMIPAISSWVALTQRVALRPGQDVLVLGATGAAGQLAVQIARHLGAGRVIAAGRDPVALARVRGLGADEVVALTGTPADGDAVAAVASEVDIVLDYLWGSVTGVVMPALCRRREAASRALAWVLIGSIAGEELALSSVLLRKRNLHVLGSGQGATTTADMFAAAPAVIAAIAAGLLQTAIREVPLAEVERHWSAPLPSGERLVFVPTGA
ncbi:MAG: zinc-binding dehydrogenase [Deltaproteobacteria bacterium]|nr:zinc-binding dehydrogenase [Deltaproteobacteria bacterium]